MWTPLVAVARGAIPQYLDTWFGQIGTAMSDRDLLRIGVVGTVVAALCCFTPLLVILLGAVGLSAAVGWLDYVLLPALAVFVGITIYSVGCRRRGVRADAQRVGIVSDSGPEADWVQQRLPSLLLWKLPIALLVASALVPLEPVVRGLLWAAAFATMGLGCVRNALRCGRLHCYFTGPLFLGLGAVSWLQGIGTLDLGKHAWSWIGGFALVGAVGLHVIPERVWGKYAER